jgi:streptogramin lyase
MKRLELLLRGFAFLLALCLSASAAIAGYDVLVANYVQGSADGQVLRYSGAGTPLGVFASVPGMKPQDLAWGPGGYLYVTTGDADGRVLRFNGTTGTFMDTFVSPGSGGLDNPYGLIFGPDGNLYVNSSHTGSVIRYHGTTGAFMDVFAYHASLTTAPHNSVFGPDGNLYVSGSRDTNNVLRFDGQTGAFMDEFIPSGSGGLNNPHDVAFGPDGNLYVCSMYGNQVLRYNGATGTFMDVFASGNGMNWPIGLGFSPDGRLYVANLLGNSIQRFNASTGAFLDTFASGGALNWPQNVLFTPEPATLALLLAGGAIALCRKKRSKTLRALCLAFALIALAPAFALADPPTFAPAQNYAVGNHPQGLGVADFNGDGRLDLAVGNRDGGDITVLYGLAGGRSPCGPTAVLARGLPPMHFFLKETRNGLATTRTTDRRRTRQFCSRKGDGLAQVRRPEGSGEAGPGGRLPPGHSRHKNPPAQSEPNTGRRPREVPGGFFAHPDR